MATDELEHTHRCQACGKTRPCDVMICRGQAEKMCWECFRRGAVPGPPR